MFALVRGSSLTAHMETDMLTVFVVCLPDGNLSVSCNFCHFNRYARLRDAAIICIPFSVMTSASTD
jgi:hypothetical protein